MKNKTNKALMLAWDIAAAFIAFSVFGVVMYKCFMEGAM